VLSQIQFSLAGIFTVLNLSPSRMFVFNLACKRLSPFRVWRASAVLCFVSGVQAPSPVSCLVRGVQAPHPVSRVARTLPSVSCGAEHCPTWVSFTWCKKTSYKPDLLVANDSSYWTVFAQWSRDTLLYFDRQTTGTQMIRCSTFRRSRCLGVGWRRCK
jgi:hypothetical protein